MLTWMIYFFLSKIQLASHDNTMFLFLGLYYPLNFYIIWFTIVGPLPLNVSLYCSQRSLIFHMTERMTYTIFFVMWKYDTLSFSCMWCEWIFPNFASLMYSHEWVFVGHILISIVYLMWGAMLLRHRSSVYSDTGFQVSDSAIL